MKWVSIKDSVPKYLPGKEQLFIVSGIDEDFNKRYVYWAQAYAYGDTDDRERIFSVPGWSKMNVTHWMQLPEPPEE